MVEDARTTRVYPDPDPRNSGRIGYFCRVCQREEICPRYGLPARGFDLTALTKGASPRVIWVCSVACLARWVDALEDEDPHELQALFDRGPHGVTAPPSG